MGFIKWLFGKKERISESALEHSSKGEFNSNYRMKGGGHGQECLDYLSKHNVKYAIVKTYDNGVRVGYVPSHKERKKRSGANQAWFPYKWDRRKIRKAGQVVARGQRMNDGETKAGFYENVNVGIKRTNSQIATIFPMSTQKNKKGVERNVLGKNKGYYSRRKNK